MDDEKVGHRKTFCTDSTEGLYIKSVWKLLER